jgi:hypothetical protein
MFHVTTPPLTLQGAPAHDMYVCAPAMESWICTLETRTPATEYVIWYCRVSPADADVLVPKFVLVVTFLTYFWSVNDWANACWGTRNCPASAHAATIASAFMPERTDLVTGPSLLE